MALPNAKKRMLGDKYDRVNLFLVDACSYDNWFENKELPDMTKKK